MGPNNVVEIARYRDKKENKESQDTKEVKEIKRKRDRLNSGKAGRVYDRRGKLWVDFHYLGERVREPSGLENTSANCKKVRKQLDLITAEIRNKTFVFAERFPRSKNRELFTILEGKTVTKDPNSITFGDYVEKWLEEMGPGMTENQKRDYKTPLNNHLLPFFGKIPFSEFKPVLIKKFIGVLKNKKNRYGTPYTPKTIRNYLIPLRVIVRDAVDEFGWYDLRDPFWGLRLPPVGRKRIQPFNFDEWRLFLKNILPWYRPYFEFAVQTGLRPSEQVALKWSAIDEACIYVELSRVRNLEKSEMKTEGSNRSIDLRPIIEETLERQKELTIRFETPYVFINSEGRPVQQENLGKIWHRALVKAGLHPRRMYETRHTFASWAIASGEPVEWVARTLGHVDTTMIYRTYSRYIPNLTRKDGSAFEAQYSRAIKN